MSWSSFEEFLTDPGGYHSLPLVTGLIIFLYIIFATLLFLGLSQFQQSRTYIQRHCQVKSVTIEGLPALDRRNQNMIMWHTVWYVTVIDEQDERIPSLDGRIVSTVSSSFQAPWLRRLTNTKKVNEIYPFYRHRDVPQPPGHDWQWEKPTMLKAFAYLFPAIIIFVFATVLFILRKYYQGVMETEGYEGAWAKHANITETV